MKIDTKTAWIIGLAGIPLMILNFTYLLDRTKESARKGREERALEEKTDSVITDAMAGSRMT